MAPYHFAVEVEDWDGFLGHLEELGIRHTRPVERPENNSKFCYIHDPDHTMIELVYHAPASVPAGADGVRPGAEVRPSRAPAADSAAKRPRQVLDGAPGVRR